MNVSHSFSLFSTSTFIVVLSFLIENDALLSPSVFPNCQLSINSRNEKSTITWCTKCFVKSPFKWDDYIVALQEYKENYNGNVNVPQNYVIHYKNKNMKLGQWVHNQRNAYRYVLEGNVQTTWGSTPLRISLKQMAQLDSIGFVWDFFDMEWDKHFNYLHAYYQQHGHSLVPQQHEVNDENNKTIKLGKWVANQRTAYRQFHKMKKEKMNTYSKKYNFGKMSWKRIIQLESIGFSWDGKTKLINNVDANIIDIQNQRGSFYDNDGFSKQSLTHRNKNNSYRTKFLSSWGDRKWYQHYQTLAEIKENQEKSEVIDSIQISEVLQRWMATQKYQYQLWEDGKASRLTLNRKEALDAIEFMRWMEIQKQGKLKEKWSSQFKKLKEYYDNQDLALSKSVEKKGKRIILENSLRLWIQQQKKRYKQNTLDKSQIDLLDTINFMQREATTKEKNFQQNLRSLKSYKSKFGDCIVPCITNVIESNSSTTADLGLWVKKQRIEYKRILSKSAHNKTFNTLLTDEAQEELNSLGFVWSQDEAEWLEMYNMYVLKYQTSNLPKMNLKDMCTYELPNVILDKWIHKQKREYVRFKNEKVACEGNGMNQMRVDALERLDFFVPFATNSSSDTLDDTYDMKWKASLECLKEYKREFGHTIVPLDYISRNDDEINSSKDCVDIPIKLGEWAKIQRKRYSGATRMNKHKPLNEKQLKSLNELDFIWCEDTFQWLEMFLIHLKTFIIKHGHCDVPSSNIRLSLWISEQRSLLQREYNNLINVNTDMPKLDELDNVCAMFRTDSIDKVKVEALNSVGFIWDLKSHKEELHWNLHFDALLSYQQINGNCQIPANYVVKTNDNSSLRLGAWVRKTQLEYKHFFLEERKEVSTDFGGGSKLSWKQIQKLDTLIDFNTTSKIINKGSLKKTDKKWLSRISELESFIISNGHCNIEQTYDEEKKDLSSWVNYVRSQYSALKRGKKSVLSEKKVRDLENIGFIWNKKDAKWNQKYNQYKSLQQSLQDENHDVELYDILPNELQMWVKKQRSHYKYLNNGICKEKIRITNEQIEKLNRLGFDWKLDNKINLRKNTSKANLPKNDSKMQKWDEMFHELKFYKEEYGDCNIPRDFKFHKTTKLATWVLVQRREYKKLLKSSESANITLSPLRKTDENNICQRKSHYITPARKEKLESIGFIWDGQLSLQVSREAKWTQMYEELKKFHVQNGHFRVPRSQGKLGVWVANQKRLSVKNRLNASSTSLTKKRIKLLKSIGFDLNTN